MRNNREEPLKFLLKNVWIFKNAINILRAEKSLFCFLQKKFEKQTEFLEIKSFKLKAQCMG